MPPVRYAQQVLLFPLYRSLSPPPISAPTSVRGLATDATKGNLLSSFSPVCPPEGFISFYCHCES